jgi:hypothetical protein
MQVTAAHLIYGIPQKSGKAETASSALVKGVIFVRYIRYQHFMLASCFLWPLSSAAPARSKTIYGNPHPRVSWHLLLVHTARLDNE